MMKYTKKVLIVVLFSLAGCRYHSKDVDCADGLRLRGAPVWESPSITAAVFYYMQDNKQHEHGIAGCDIR